MSDHKPGEPFAQYASCVRFKRKIKATNEGNQKMVGGHFDKHICCPLCYMVCSKNTNDNGTTNHLTRLDLQCVVDK